MPVLPFQVGCRVKCYTMYVIQCMLYNVCYSSKFSRYLQLFKVVLGMLYKFWRFQKMLCKYQTSTYTDYLDIETGRYIYNIYL